MEAHQKKGLYSNRNLEFYDGGEESEEYLKRPYHRLRIEKAAAIIHRELVRIKTTTDNPRALDIGCSSGHATNIIFRQHPHVKVFGLDLSASALEKASRYGVSGVVGDVEAPLPFPNEHFDIVFAGEVIEHIIEVDDFLREIRRCLKTQGLLVLTTPNLARLIDRVRFIFGISPKQNTPMHRYLKYHVTPFTFSSLRDCLARTGFRVESFTSNYVYLDPKGQGSLKSRLAANLFPSFGGTLIVSARRSR